MFGYCGAGQHTICKVKYTRFWFEMKRKKSVIVYDDKETFCDCYCHNPTAAKKAAPRGRKRKA